MIDSLQVSRWRRPVVLGQRLNSIPIRQQPRFDIILSGMGVESLRGTRLISGTSQEALCFLCILEIREHINQTDDGRNPGILQFQPDASHQFVLPSITTKDHITTKDRG